MIRRLVMLAMLGAFIYLGATVKLGKRTFFGHIANIWRADETQEMVEGVRQKGGPALDKVKRGVKAGWQEVRKGDEGSADGGAHDGGHPAPATAEQGEDAGVTP
jgi:hypothetical protein